MVVLAIYNPAITLLALLYCIHNVGKDVDVMPFFSIDVYTQHIKSNMHGAH